MSSIAEIIYPYHSKRLDDVKKNHLCFSHYTRADTAYKILDNQEIWLRNVLVMNDYREFEHGKELLLEVLNSKPEGESLKNAFKQLNSNAFEQIYAWLEKFSDSAKNDQYIACFSEHEPADMLGKLSMWRAYGANTGVALIFDSDLFFNAISDDFPLTFSSVAYSPKEEFATEIGILAKSITDNLEWLKKGSIDISTLIISSILIRTCICNKHPGFDEEREWRLIANPFSTKNFRDYTDILRCETEVVNGIPQTIVKLKLENLNWQGKSFHHLIKNIIIGPCKNPSVTYECFYRLLISKGVNNPAEIIQISDIPFRI